MPAFLVQHLATSGHTHKGGANAMVVFADDSTDAINICQSKQTGISDVVWTNATVTEVIASPDVEGWTLQVTVSAPTPIDLTVTGASSSTINELADLMVIQLNADAQIAGSANTAGNLLTVSDIADDLGDLTITVAIRPPIATFPGAVAIDGMVGAIVHEGIAAAVLTAQLAVDAFVIPTVLKTVTAA